MARADPNRSFMKDVKRIIIKVISFDRLAAAAPSPRLSPLARSKRRSMLFRIAAFPEAVSESNPRLVF
jgi:hypothetical protein